MALVTGSNLHRSHQDRGTSHNGLDPGNLRADRAVRVVLCIRLNISKIQDLEFDTKLDTIIDVDKI